MPVYQAVEVSSAVTIRCVSQTVEQYVLWFMLHGMGIHAAWPTRQSEPAHSRVILFEIFDSWKRVKEICVILESAWCLGPLLCFHSGAVNSLCPDDAMLQYKILINPIYNNDMMRTFASLCLSCRHSRPLCDITRIWNMEIYISLILTSSLLIQ